MRSVHKAFIFAFALLSLIQLSNTAVAATYTLGSNTGTAQYANSNFGQTFTIPAGSNGTLVSISNVYVAFRGNPATGVVDMKVYTAPDKTTLVATASNTCSDTTADNDSFQGVTCTFNFSNTTLNAGSSYYWEVSRVSGQASFYLWQYNTNAYAGGQMYQAGTAYVGWDNQFTLTYTTTSVAVTSLTVPNGVLTYRTPSNITFQSDVAGVAKFKANGKPVGGCVRLSVTAANSFTATCAYKPSTRNPVNVTVAFTPSDTGYSSQTLVTRTFLISGRTTLRN